MWIKEMIFLELRAGMDTLLVLIEHTRWKACGVKAGLTISPTCTETWGKLRCRERQATVQEDKRPLGPSSWFQAVLPILIFYKIPIYPSICS